MTETGPFDGLNTDERRIAELLVAGMNTSEIAKRLSLAYNTVAETGKTIRRKLGVPDLAALRRLAGSVRKHD